MQIFYSLSKMIFVGRQLLKLLSTLLNIISNGYCISKSLQPTRSDKADKH